QDASKAAVSVSVKTVAHSSASRHDVIVDGRRSSDWMTQMSLLDRSDLSHALSVLLAKMQALGGWLASRGGVLRLTSESPGFLDEDEPRLVELGVTHKVDRGCDAVLQINLQAMDSLVADHYHAVGESLSRSSSSFSVVGDPQTSMGVSASSAVRVAVESSADVSPAWTLPSPLLRASVLSLPVPSASSVRSMRVAPASWFLAWSSARWIRPDLRVLLAGLRLRFPVSAARTALPGIGSAVCLGFFAGGAWAPVPVSEALAFLASSAFRSSQRRMTRKRWVFCRSPSLAKTSLPSFLGQFSFGRSSRRLRLLSSELHQMKMQPSVLADLTTLTGRPARSWSMSAASMVRQALSSSSAVRSCSSPKTMTAGSPSAGGRPAVPRSRRRRSLRRWLRVRRASAEGPVARAGMSPAEPAASPSAPGGAALVPESPAGVAGAPASAGVKEADDAIAESGKEYHEQLGTVQLIDLFESFKSHDGVLYYLAGVLGSSSDPEVHFRYIQAACRAGQTQELERVVRESASYEPERVKNFLKDAGLADQLPLLIVCDRFDFISDLVLHLYRQPQLHKYLEIFVQKVNPARLPEVVAALLELDCPEDTVRQLVSLAGTDFSVEALVEAAESRNRLRLLQSWLEARSANGDTQAAVHNALAKIYIDTNTGAERFLRDNQHYDSKVVGRYTEKRNPNLAVLAYERGGCADDLIRVCQENSFYKTLARFLVRRKDEALWTSVLREPSDHRRQLIDQVVQTALGETTDAEEISATVRAFMLAELPNHLLELLEKIVLDSSAFSEHRNLQNLLILTAIKADKARVMDYVTKLDNFDGPQVANLAIAGQLYEEAFAIFVKFRSNLDAAKVLIDHMADLTRAHEFAERCNEPQVWSLLGSALLRSRQLEGSVDALLRAGDPSLYREMAAACAEQSDWQTLVRYLTLARQLREPFVDSELMFGLAKTGRLSELDRMLSEPNSANVSAVADRCYAEGLYEAARRLYQSVSSFAKLAATLARLGEYPAAVEAARKANSTATWRELCRVCVETGELNLAQTCGVSLLGDADQLEQLVTFYESRGLFAEALALLEAGLGTDKAHMGVYTELAVLYTKYKPEKLRDYLDLFWSRLNIPRVIRAAEAAHLWSEAVLLYDKYEEYDSAALTMMRHPTDCWREALFKETVAKCANAEVFYKALQFYLEFKPMAINDLLMTLTPRLDHSRVVSILNRHDRLALAKPYLKSVQPTANNRQVNDALNGLYIAEEDYASLRQSVEQFANIDSLALAQKLERHELLEFRRVAALLYKQNSRYDRCLEICKADAMNKATSKFSEKNSFLFFNLLSARDQDAMLYAAESRDPALASGLLDWFLQRGDSDCYAACLYRCYDLLRPDDVLELAWKHGLTDKSMPYLIQVLHEYTKKVDEVVEELRQLKGVQGDSQLQREPMLMIAPSVVQQLPPPSPINQHQQQQQQQQPRPPQSLPTPAPPRPPAAASPTSPSGGGGGKSKPPVPPPPRSASPSSGAAGPPENLWSRADVQCAPEISAAAMSSEPTSSMAECTYKAEQNSVPTDFLVAQFHRLARTCSVGKYCSVRHHLSPGQTADCEVYYRYPRGYRAYNAKLTDVWLADDTYRLDNQLCQADEDTNRLHPVNVQWTSDGAVFDGTTAYAVLNKSSLSFASGLTWLLRFKRQPRDQPFFEFANCSDMNQISGHGVHLWEISSPMRLYARANRITGAQLPFFELLAQHRIHLFVNDSFVPRSSLTESPDSDAAWVDNQGLCLYLGMRLDHSTNPKFMGTFRTIAFANSNMTEEEIR
uniref:Clathrin-link domain-containing protein n=1 Tax=Macrostomum lignano TaxID=282301 RepID=A0A1I8JLA4_9PLAT